MNMQSFSKQNNSSKDAMSFAPSFAPAKVSTSAFCGDDCTSANTNIAFFTDIVFTMSVLFCIFALDSLISIIILICAIIIKLKKLPKKQVAASLI